MASSDDENESMEVETRQVKSKYRKILDSDSSDDEKSEVKDPEGNKNISRNQLGSDESDNDGLNKSIKSDSMNERAAVQDPDESFKGNKQKSKLYDTDSSDDENPKTNDSAKEKSKLIDSDSSDEEKQPSQTTKNRRKGVPKKLDIKKPKEKPQRKSAKAAMEGIKDELNIKEISEKQKTERDREIRIPYHKPKQYTLKEFLARKTINKPTVGSASTESKPTILKMKMNTEDLEKFAQKMKEREEEAIEFFKSESEDEEETEVPKEVPSELPVVDEKPEITNEIENPPEVQQIENVLVEPREESPGKENISEQIASPVKKEPQSVLKTLDEMNGKDVTIDLSTGDIQPKKLTGADMLFNRYLKTISKPKHKDSVSMNIISIENGKLENQRVEVRLDKEIELDHNRPGFSHELLKKQLRSKVMEERLVKMQKKNLKQPEPIELEPEDKCKNIEVDNKDEVLSDGDYDPNDDSDEMDSGDETNMKESKKEKCAFVDDEAEDDDPEENGSDESSSSSDESDSENEVATEPKKGRILKAFDDSDDEVDQPINQPEIPSNNLESQEEIEQISQEPSQNFYTERSDFTFTEPSVSQDIRTSHVHDLFDSERMSQLDNDDDLMALCSGQFAIPKTQSIPISQLAGLSEFKDLLDTDDFVSQVPERVEETPKIPDVTEPSQIESEPIVESKLPDKNEIRKLLESSDDESNEPEKVKTKKKKKKRKHVKLGFSDDESDAENQLREDFLDDEILEEEEEEIPANDEVLIDYDSEENEIEVKVTNKQRLKMAGDYFENEAELSESEWGSADEDEKGMDNYEKDLADEEQFDQAQLREEVGRIHARKLMDDDLKKVKKIQDLLFEDEENDGIGRERKFRWKNQAEGFTLEDENAQDGDNLENADAEDESEVMWRRMRHEREVLINEQSQKIENETMSEEILLLDQNSQTVSCSNTSVLVKRKFQIIRTTSSTFGALNNNGEKKESPFLIKNGKSTTSNSFLSRDPKTLRRIASFMSNKPDDEVTNMSSHGGNSMSFIPCEKPTADSKKRKSNENVKSENVKKRKVESQGFMLLDKLH